MLLEVSIPPLISLSAVAVSTGDLCKCYTSRYGGSCGTAELARFHISLLWRYHHNLRTARCDQLFRFLTRASRVWDPENTR